MKYKQIQEYDVVRVIVTLLVIIGHCMYFKITTNSYGEWDYSIYTVSGLSFIYRLANFVRRIIYTFHMPLYMMLSGALFRYTEISSGGYDSLRFLIKKKARNLLLPFFVVTLCYVVPLKAISGYYTVSTNLFRDIFVGQVLLQGNNHLWFLPTLFFIFLIIYQINRLIQRDDLLKLIVLFSLSLFSDIIQIALLSSILRYAFWFYIGYYFENRRHRINDSIDRSLIKPICSAFIWILLSIINIDQQASEGVYLLIGIALKNICTFCACYTVYCFCYLLTKTKLPQSKIFQHIRNNTFGLYLYSDPLNYLIVLFAFNCFGGCIFTTNLASMGLLLARFILSTLGAYSLSCIIRHFKLKYFC